MVDALVLLVRTQLRRRWGAYVALAVVVAVSGAVAMAAVAGARRTASTFERHLAANHASALSINVDDLSPATQQRLEALPGVIGVQTYAGVLVAPIDPATGELLGSLTDQEPIVSVDGRYLDQDRAALLDGRLPRADRADEVMVDRSFRRARGVDVGDRMTLVLVDPATYEPLRHAEVTVTGVGVTTEDVAVDDIDDLQRIVLTPAFLAENPDVATNDPASSTYWWSGLRLAPGTDVAAVEAAWEASAPGTDGDSLFRYRRTSTLHATVQRTIRPQVVALAAFGAFAAVLALALTAQVTWRTIRSGRADAAVLRTLGASPRMSTAGPAIAAAIAVVVGALGAVAGAIALSPLAPIGPVRDIEPHPGVVADLVALGPGWLLLVGCGLGVALLAGVRVTLPQARPGPSRQRIQSPLPLVLGLRFAFGRRSGAGRSAVTAAVVATIAVVATLAYTTNLRHLTRTPRLFGADFGAAFQIGAGYGEFDPELLDGYLTEHGTGQVRAWASLTYGNVRIGDLAVPVFGLDVGRGSVSPTLVEGRPPAAPGEIVLGSDTLERVGVAIGDPVEVDGRPHRIVGTAVMPALGQATGDHPTLGTGGWLTGDGLRALISDADGSALGASALLLDPLPGADLDALVEALEADPAAWGVTGEDAEDTDGLISVLRPPRPGELVGVDPSGTAPAVMAALLAAGAMVALGIALVASVRSRRRDLSVLKALGFTRHQITLMVQTQATATVLAGAVIGIPLGVALGSTIWRRFADDLGVLAETRVPILVITLAFAAGLLAALAFTAIPSRTAARTPAALVLRSE
jgi:hypothetical protein